MNRTKAALVLYALWLALLWPTGSLLAYRDLETGTFLTRDPAGMVDGPNLYAYVRQNPWTHFDPEGLETAAVSRWALHPETMPNTQAFGEVTAAVTETTAKVAGAVVVGTAKVAGGFLAGTNPVAQAQYQQMVNPDASQAQIQQNTENQLEFNNAVNSLGIPESAGRPEMGIPEPGKPIPGSGRIGDVGTMRDLKVPGAGTGLERHEIPSRAAQEMAFVQQFITQTGRRPTTSEINSAMQNNPAVLIPPDTHAATDTYGNNNNRSQIKKDSQNLDEAARRGREDLQQAAKKTNTPLPTKTARELRETQDRTNQP